MSEMTEMAEMMREFLTGEDMFDEKKGRKTLEETMAKFSSRSRGLRILCFLGGLFVAALMIFSAIKFVGLSGDVATPDHVLYGVMFLSGMGGISMLKLLMFFSHYHMEMMKAQKRMEFRILEELGR